MLASFTSVHYCLDGIISYWSWCWNVAGVVAMLRCKALKRADNIQWGWTVSPEDISVLVGMYHHVSGPLLSPLVFMYLSAWSHMIDWQYHIFCHGALVRDQTAQSVHHSLLMVPNCFKPLCDRNSLPWCLSWNYELNKPFLPWVVFVFYHYNKKIKQTKPTNTDDFWL